MGETFAMTNGRKGINYCLVLGKEGAEMEQIGKKGFFPTESGGISVWAAALKGGWPWFQ